MRQKWAVLFLNGQPSTDEREKANIYGISTCGLVVEKTDFQAHTHTQKKVIISRMWRHLGRATSESFGVVGDIVRVLSPRQAISNA